MRKTKKKIKFIELSMEEQAAVVDKFSRMVDSLTSRYIDKSNPGNKEKTNSEELKLLKKRIVKESRNVEVLKNLMPEQKIKSKKETVVLKDNGEFEIEKLESNKKLDSSNDQTIKK